MRGVGLTDRRRGNMNVIIIAVTVKTAGAKVMVRLKQFSGNQDMKNTTETKISITKKDHVRN